MNRKFSMSICLLSAACIAAIFGCSAASDTPAEQPGVSEEPLYVDMNHLWPTSRAIFVCWNNNAATNDASKKANARLRVELAWTRTAGIHFEGWDICGDEDNWGIHLTWATIADGRSYTVGDLGMHTDLLADIVLDDTNGIYAVAHEFGHALGFAHEQNRPDNTTCLPCNVNTPCADPYAVCVDPNGVVNPTTGGYCRQGGNGTPNGVLTPYDEQSIMSYCNGTTGGGPSPLDVVGARAAYSGLRPLKLSDEFNLCMSVNGVDSHGAGAGVLTDYCAPKTGDAKLDEQWDMRPTDSGYFRLVNLASSLCLGVSGVESHGEGSPVEAYYCEPGVGPWGWDARRDGEWRFAWDSSGRATLRNRLSDMAIAGATTNSGPGWLYMTAATANGKKWKLLDPQVSYNYRMIKLSNAVSGLCVGKTGYDTASGGSAELYNCAPAWNDAKQDEEWYVRATTNGYFNLVNSSSGRCLGVNGVNSHSRGSRVNIDVCSHQDAEWTWAPGTNTSKYTQQLVNRVSGLCLGVPYNDNHGAGSALEVWDCPPVAGDPRNDENWFAY